MKAAYTVGVILFTYGMITDSPGWGRLIYLPLLWFLLNNLFKLFEEADG
jgi:hypothetical protein